MCASGCVREWVSIVSERERLLCVRVGKKIMCVHLRAQTQADTPAAVVGAVTEERMHLPRSQPLQIEALCPYQRAHRLSLCLSCRALGLGRSVYKCMCVHAFVCMIAHEHDLCMCINVLIW